MEDAVEDAVHVAGLGDPFHSCPVRQERREDMEDAPVLEPADGAPVGGDDETPLAFRSGHDGPVKKLTWPVTKVVKQADPGLIQSVSR